MERNAILARFALVTTILARVLLKFSTRANLARGLSFGVLKLARRTFVADQAAYGRTKVAWCARRAKTLVRSTAALACLYARTRSAFPALHLTSCVLELAVWAVIAG